MTDLIDPERLVATAHGHEPPRRSPAGPGSLIDLVLLTEITGSNVQTRAEVVAEFMRVNEVDAERLRHAVRAGDYNRVVELSHGIKGAGLMLGATLLANTCGRLETAASLNDLGQVQAAMLGLEVEILRLNKFLDTLIQGSGAAADSQAGTSLQGTAEQFRRGVM